jgi:hypothetical protein
LTAKRTDSNQRVIVDAFRERGLSVLVMSDLGKGAPDIAVGTNGMTFLFEIKDGAKPLSAQKLTPHEQKFFDSWHGHYEIIRSVDEVHKFIESVQRRFHLWINL